MTDETPCSCKCGNWKEKSWKRPKKGGSVLLYVKGPKGPFHRGREGEAQAGSHRLPSLPSQLPVSRGHHVARHLDVRETHHPRRLGRLRLPGDLLSNLWHP